MGRGEEEKAEAIFGAHVTTGSRGRALVKGKGGKGTYPNTPRRQDSFIMSSSTPPLMHP